GNTYIGEIGSKGLPNGLGYIAFENGDLWQSSFDNGNRKAIGLHLAYDGEWQTVNCKGKDATVVSTSEYYAKIDEKRRKQWNLFWYGDENGNFWTAMSDIANELDNFSHSLLGDGNNSASYNAPDGSSLLDSPSNSNGGNYQLQYDNWARRAESHYNSLTNLGWSATSKTGRKSGGTGQGMNGGNYVSMKQSLREAQREMQKIRQRAAKAGVIITPAKWETATVRY
ncbi:MAG: hypothetical protein IK084_00145, partial [Bacteroidaceae bacterium]|nr:hypothetical protein [Bacteroidaceae bacterium]